jgi:glutaredoxin 3
MWLGALGVLASVAALAQSTWGVVGSASGVSRKALEVAAPIVVGVRGENQEPSTTPTTEPRTMPTARVDSELDPATEAQIRRFWKTATTSSPADAEKGAPTASHTETLADPSAAPISAQRSAAPAPNAHIIVYTTAWCPVCKRAKAWMRTQGIAFEERDVEASAINARQMRFINPRGGVPTFNVEGQVLVGFDPNEVMSSIRRATEQR